MPQSRTPPKSEGILWMATSKLGEKVKGTTNRTLMALGSGKLSELTSADYLERCWRQFCEMYSWWMLPLSTPASTSKEAYIVILGVDSMTAEKFFHD